LKAVVEAKNLSKWYGNVLGISDVTLDIKPGIVGLLGPNGAGKSTFLKLMGGQLKPNIGTITILGQPVFSNPSVFSKIGFCPEFDCYYKELTGWQQVVFLAKLRGLQVPRAEEMSAEALEKVGLMESRDRHIREYSLGMRQRLKIATTIVHQPDILLLDEPLRGIDPLWRVRIIEIIKSIEREGKTVIVASHILPEIEALTNDIIMIHQGKVFAQGNIQYIRDLIDSHPHMVSIHTDQPRKLASSLINNQFVLDVHFEADGEAVMFKTNNRDQFFERLQEYILEGDIEIDEITSPDDNLQAVFDYLVGR
jgi:ABC-2 type transport system ATP-binding protein